MLVMKVIEKLADFPVIERRLKGLAAEAHELLKASPKGQVLKVELDGQNPAAVKRAFAAAAKALGGAAESRDGDNGTILVRWTAGLPKRLRGVAKPQHLHSEAHVEAEAKRLYVTAGNPATDYGKLAGDAKKKLFISAKRNLSRAANR